MKILLGDIKNVLRSARFRLFHKITVKFFIEIIFLK